MSVLAQPPSNHNSDLLHYVRAALRKTGRLLPATDEEVTEALNTIEVRRRESQPNLSDPYELFETGSSGASEDASETREEQKTTSPRQDEINRSLALARNGDDEIPPEVREQMEQDRKDQEKDDSDEGVEKAPPEEENNEHNE